LFIPVHHHGSIGEVSHHGSIGEVSHYFITMMIV